MTAHEDRRTDPRYKTNVSLILQTFESLDVHPVRERDHSNNGVSFTNSFNLKPGTVVHIRHENCPEGCLGGDACNTCRSTTLAVVQWCQKGEHSERPVYQIGAKFFEYGIGY